jgi:hypothetical protein
LKELVSSQTKLLENGSSRDGVENIGDIHLQHKLIGINI